MPDDASVCFPTLRSAEATSVTRTGPSRESGVARARWSTRAADWALRTDLNESIRRWRNAIHLLDEAPPSEEGLEIGLRARFGLTTIAIKRAKAGPGEVAMVSPGPDDVVQPGDVLALRYGHDDEDHSGPSDDDHADHDESDEDRD